MFENLTNSDVLILGGLIGVIIVIGVICIILTIKGGKNSSSKKETDEERISVPEPDIHIALATENIPSIETVKQSSPQIGSMYEPYEAEEITILDEPVSIPTPVETSKVAEFPSYAPVEPAPAPKYVPSYEPIYEIYDDEVTTPSNNIGLEEAQDAKNGASIEEVLKAMQGDLEKQKYETIDRYEEEQEENAVISYQELLNRKLALNNEEILKVEKAEETSSNYLDELPDFKDIVLEPIPDRDENRPFMNSEFVSPIFGRLSSNVEYPTVKKTVETEELVQTSILKDDEFDINTENDEFLNTLKEFRRNL
jgi:hypothetical protein